MLSGERYAFENITCNQSTAPSDSWQNAQEYDRKPITSTFDIWYHLVMYKSFHPIMSCRVMQCVYCKVELIRMKFEYQFNFREQCNLTPFLFISMRQISGHILWIRQNVKRQNYDKINGYYQFYFYHEPCLRITWKTSF